MGKSTVKRLTLPPAYRAFRAWLGCRAVAMTQDHKPMDTEEYARIMKVGQPALFLAGLPGSLTHRFPTVADLHVQRL